MSNSEGMSNSEVKIINVEHQIIHSCIRNKTGSKCDWNPNIGQLYSMKEVDSQQHVADACTYNISYNKTMFDGGQVQIN